MSGSVEEVANVVYGLVSTQVQVSGSRLAQAIKARFPEWHVSSAGARTLREFIATHVSGVVEVGRSGLDVIYGLKAATLPGVALEAGSPLAGSKPFSGGGDGRQPIPNQGADYWRVWVSPNSPFAIAIDRATGAAEVVRREASPSEEKALLESPSVSDQKAIAKDFLSEVVEPILRGRLEAILAEPSQGPWWLRWGKDLRGTDQLANWNRFRRLRMEGLLRTKLGEAGISEELAAKVLDLVRDRHEQVVPKRIPSAPSEKVGREAAEEELRQLVVRVVKGMSVADLRELRLPLGLVVDALATSSDSR